MRHLTRFHAPGSAPVDQRAGRSPRRSREGRSLERSTRLGRWIALLLLASLLPGQNADGPRMPQLDEFKLIAERNIFNPNRSSRKAQAERPPPREERPPRTEALALLGTLSYEKGEFAVFGGSDSAFRKVLTVSDTVAGCKILAVTTDHVELEQDGERIELRVGMQLERKEQGQWTPSGAAKPAEERPTLVSVTNQGAGATATAEDDDVLKRLLQKREQELNK